MTGRFSQKTETKTETERLKGFWKPFGRFFSRSKTPRTPFYQTPCKKP